MPTQPSWMDALEETIRRTIAEALWDRDVPDALELHEHGLPPVSLRGAGIRVLLADLDRPYPVLRGLGGMANSRGFCGAPAGTLLISGCIRSGPPIAYAIEFFLRERPWDKVRRADFSQLCKVPDLQSPGTETWRTRAPLLR